MASFVRFVFTILIVGMLVNLGVVLLANAHSQRAQELQYNQDAQRFESLVSAIDGAFRRANIIVEEQRIGANSEVRESTLLIRQYQDTLSGEGQPLPIVRIVIPGDTLQVQGVLLEFDKEFTGPDGEYKMLAGRKIPLFATICGTGEVAPANPAIDDERFTFFPHDKVPELVRLNPDLPQASYFELKLWQYLWSQIRELPRNATLPWTTPDAGRMKATWFVSDLASPLHLKRGQTYAAFVGTDGVSVKIAGSSIPNLIQSMIDEKARIDLEEAQEKP